MSSDDIQEINRKNKRAEFLARENALLRAYLAQHGDGADLYERDNAKALSGKARGRNTAEATQEQKLEAANAVSDALRREVEETKRGADKLIDTLKAVLEETDIRIAELRKDAYEFKRDIVVGAENFRTGKIMAEKVIRYMEEKLRQKDSSIEKLKLKNATIKNQIQKLEQQLKQKEEMGDVLHYIDFHQLQIENKQNVQKIEQRNQELLKLKMTTGRIVQLLQNKKTELNDCMSVCDYVRREIATRREGLQKVKDENARVARYIARRQRAMKTEKNQEEDTSEMPQILDYVKQKALMYELEAEVRDWTRKCEIASIGRKQQQQQPEI